MTPQTTMQHAFARAGVQSPMQRLEALARQAIAAFPRDFAAAGRHLDGLLVAAETCPLERALTRDTRAACISALLRRVSYALRAEQGEPGTQRRDGGAVQHYVAAQGASDRPAIAAHGGGGGQTAVGHQTKLAPSAATPTPARAGAGAGHSTADPHARAARPAVAAPRPSRLTPAAMAAGAPLAAGALLMMLVNGAPLHALSVVEARAWGAKHETMGRFVRNLLHGVPDVGRVGDYVTESAAEAAMKLAQEATNALG